MVNVGLLELSRIIIIPGEKYQQSVTDNAYKIQMKLTILSVEESDYGMYKCISKNSLGETDGSIKLYRKHCILYFF